MIKDTDYFNDKLFVYSNEDLKEALLKHSKEKGETLYLIVDEALRKYLNENDVKFETKPKKAVLV